MGEVYRARDSRLERDVALNHPHIAGVYGLEDGGGQRFIAMELVDGESLAERLRGGALPVDEAVATADLLDALLHRQPDAQLRRDTDGRRFLFIKDATPNPTATPVSLVVALNWFDEIRAKLRK